MPPEMPGARDLARQFVAGDPTRGDAPGGAALSARDACERVFCELARWVGATGTHALFARAIAQARPEHPVLAEIGLRDESDPKLQGVAEAIQAHGAAAVASALEALLVTLFELLGRLVGGDMVMRMLERRPPPRTRDDE